MTSLFKGSVEYLGLVNNPPNLPAISCCKQHNLQTTLCLKPSRPDISRIIKVMSDIIIDSTRVIKTPEGISQEGLVLSGKCLVVEGEVVQNIEYIADSQYSKVYAEHFTIPFNSHIILPKEFMGGTPLAVAGYLEDVFTEILDNRTIFENISILFAAEY